MGRNETWRESAYVQSTDENDYGEYIEGRVFVGMAFDLPSNLSDTFQAIKKACTTVGLDARRVDDIQDSGPIPVQILRAIEDAEFLIFDLTVERPNVYYELGYAHGVGNRSQEIILLAKAGTNIHFDVASLRILYYQSAMDLEHKLIPRLQYMIEHYRP